MKPNFIIAGAAKAGTTALYYYMQQHPEIAFPSLKEPKYFSAKANSFPHKGVGDTSVDRYVVKDKKQYYKLFDSLPNVKRIGEASPDYLYFHEATSKNIKQELGDIPIIFVLRNPVNRAFSAYSYLKRDNREKLSFREGLEQEQERLANNYDFIWSYKKGGEYSTQLTSFFEDFSKVKVLIFEEFLADKQEVISDIFEFLNVDDNFKVDFSTQHNPSGVPQNTFAKFLLSRNNSVSTNLREFAKRVVPRTILEKNAKKMLVKEKISEEDYQFLTEYFKKEVTQLEQLLGKDLSIWRK